MALDGRPFVLAETGARAVPVLLPASASGPDGLAAESLRETARRELGVVLAAAASEAPARLVAVRPPWSETAMGLLSGAGAVDRSGSLVALAGIGEGLREQGFVVHCLPSPSGEVLVVAAETAIGLRNGLLTVSDRLYRDSAGQVVIDPCAGAHSPAFVRRHLKTDAMNLGPFRFETGYWDPTTERGVHEFVDWLASFRLTDYDLLAFMRGWGTTYASARFPGLSDPQHPNVRHEYYPQLIARCHAWGLRVRAADIYLASGYTMEVETEPAMLAPHADAAQLPPFRAGEGSFADILGNPAAIACLAHPRAGAYYAAVVADLLEHYPDLDGLNFHVGHAFPGKICRCPQCRDLRGNREGVYQCFARAYETAVGIKPDLGVMVATKMFGDATRAIVDHADEFPQLELFSWLRWIGNVLLEQVDGPLVMGHEDGGGGLEANHDPEKTLTQIRAHFRDYESWLRTYVQLSRASGLSCFSWEPALQRELQHMLFAYSQFTWEPDLAWGELARRYLIRSTRRLDPALTEAYRLALEANAAVTRWGLSPYDAISQRVIQIPELVGTTEVVDRVAALGDAVRGLGLQARPPDDPPVAFDLGHSLARTWQRLSRGQVLGMWH
jgi:hypothetical protein